MQQRKIKSISKSKPTLEGAGVHLKRAFGYHDTPGFDPFLMLDDFRANDPKNYLKGFPWHPHRGIETITYVIEGDVKHEDSLGNKGIISSGDVQWMTAGSGIIHQEMPVGDSSGRMYGFQIWANLPSSHKMMPPRYQEVKKCDIPELFLENGIKIKLLSGIINGTTGPVQDIIIDPELIDITIPPNSEFIHQTKNNYTLFLYVIDGRIYFPYDDKTIADNESLVLFDNGDQIKISTKNESGRFLFFSGKPLGEPIAWGGPIVMNTEEELRTAFSEYSNGSFIK